MYTYPRHSLLMRNTRHRPHDTGLSCGLRRLAYGKNVLARGPEWVKSAFAAGKLTITLSNSSMVVHHGVVVPPPPEGCANQTYSTAVTQVVAGAKAPVKVPFKIVGDELVVECAKGTVEEPVLINGDASDCFLYGSESGLPAPPLAVTCA